MEKNNLGKETVMKPESGAQIIHGHVRGGVVVPDESVTLPEGTAVRIEIVAKPRAEKWPRQGGRWKGKVHIAEDFDELPDDIAEAFGRKDPKASYKQVSL